MSKLLWNNTILLFVTKNNAKHFHQKKIYLTKFGIKPQQMHKKKRYKRLLKTSQNCVLSGQKKMGSYQNFEDFVSFNA